MSNKLDNSDDEKDESKSNAPGTSKQFQRTLRKFQTTQMPALNGEESMKNRISSVEDAIVTQDHLNGVTAEMCSNLSDDLNANVKFLSNSLLLAQQSFEDKLQQLKKEYDHRFEMQTAENKRLQNRVAGLKEETSQLQRKLDVSVDRIKKLQREFGVEDDNWDEVFLDEYRASTASPTSPMSSSSSRR